MFPNRLKRLRTRCNLTHQQMADKLGITRQAYGHYENGKREPDYKTLKRIADLFDTSIDYLLGRSDTPSESCSESSRVPLSEKFSFLDDIDQELLRQFAEAVKDDPYQSLFFDDILSASKEEREEIVRGLLELRKKYKSGGKSK